MQRHTNVWVADPFSLGIALLVPGKKRPDNIQVPGSGVPEAQINF